MAKFDWTLTDTDIEYTRRLMMYCMEHNIEYFSSDDFRDADLHNLCKFPICYQPPHSPLHRRCFRNQKRCPHLKMQDPQHEIGAHFAKLKANGVYENVGEIPSEIPSNNVRKVDLWRFNWGRWREIIQSRLVHV